tara:strand:+ start:9142 stop:10839 length:1698 start_codon:yes stop_codon:yes gene_type:complete
VTRLTLLLLLGLAACWHKPVHVEVKSGKVRVHVHKVKSKPHEFHWHTDVAARSHRFALEFEGVNLLENLKPTASTSTLREFRSFHRIRHLCVRTIARASSGVNTADFWVLVTVGHTGDSTVLYQRKPLRIVATGNHVITIDNPAPGMPIAHGQGLPLVHFRFDCTTGKQVPTDQFKDLPADKMAKVPPFNCAMPLSPWWVHDPHTACVDVALRETRRYEPFEQTLYTPAFPGMTGGQQQFGAFQVLPEINSNGYRLGSWRAQLYQEACRPAHFLHPDGRRVTEDDYPETVLTSSGWIHERSRGNYWIKHTYPSSPWKDKGARTKSGTAWCMWDAQHWSINALAQFAYLYDDPGARMLVEDLAESWLWSNPVTNKGTTHHHVASNARGRGRVLEAGCAIAGVLTGDQRARVVDRVDKLFSVQLAEFDRCIAQNVPAVVWRNDTASVWQHGLWVKGLFATAVLLEHRQHDAHKIARHVALWVLDGFKNYGGRWYVPYLLQKNGSYSTKPSGQLSLWCLPAIELLAQYERRAMTKRQGQKADEILAQFYADPPINGGYGDQMKWRVVK